MVALLERIRLTLGRPEAPRPATAPGERVYAIGDVHGRHDLLTQLLGRIREECAGREPAATTIVLLGDIIDRGPESARCVRTARDGCAWATLLCLKGNHEAAMLDALTGDAGSTRVWLRHGGLAALESWGVEIGDLDEAQLADLARAVIPADDRDWLRALPTSHRSGDYLFVHAGVRPGVALDRQDEADLLWIREPFLGSRARHGAVVVHGHTVREEVEDRGNRIGIDTGAHATGRLTALGLDGTDRWLLQTGAGEGVSAP